MEKLLKNLKRIGLLMTAVLMTGSLYAQDKSIEELTELSLEELLNLEVTTASKTAERISDAAGVISVITQDDISRYGGNTLLDILERVPSLNATTAYFTDRKMIASRGDQTRINSGHILYLINGRPTREIVEGGVSSEMLAAFPVNAIQRVEVIRGPGSVLYGSNAFSAVVNIITKESEGSNVEIAGQVGQDGAYGTNATISLQKKDFSLLGAANILKKQPWNTTWSGFDIFSPTFDLTDYDVTIPEESKGFYLGADYKKLHVSASHNEFTTSYFQFFPMDNNWSKTFGNIGYDFNITDAWDLDVNVTYNYATFQSGDFPGIERESNDMVAEFTNHIRLNEKSRVVVGGLYNYIKGSEVLVESDPHVVIADDERNSFALYSQLDYWVMDELKLIGGFQANKVENVEIAIVPRFGAIWYPIEKLNVKALYGQAFRAASIDEIGLQYAGFTGNPNINPEKVGTMDLGINYLGDKVQLGFNYFNNKQTDIIAPGEVDGASMYVNQGQIRFNGFEFEGVYMLNRQWHLVGSFLQQNNENQDGVENVTALPNFSAKGGLSYKSDKGFTASIYNLYYGSPDEKYLTSTLNPHTGAYYKMNLYASIDLVKVFNLNMENKIQFYVQGDNMLNDEVWLPNWGNTVGESIPYLQGRSVFLGIRASLK